MSRDRARPRQTDRVPAAPEPRPEPARPAGRGDRAAKPADPAAPGADRAARILLAVAAGLAIGRAVFTLVPGTWLWPLAVPRFLHPVAAWLPWLIAAMALLPPLARRATPVLERWGDAIARGRGGVLVALAAGTLVALMPDQVRYVGDFLLRQGTVELAEKPGTLFPQALPLDVFLHYTLPLRLTGTGWIDANGAARLIGAIEAALLGVLAVAFVRTLALRGVAAAAAAAVILFGGYLGMFTGYSKAFADLCVLVALAGVSALSVLRTGRGLLPLGIALALGIALHRSALGMLPAAAFVWAWWWSARGRGRPATDASRGGRAADRSGAAVWRRADVLLGLALPLAALAITGPRIVATIAGTDTAVHFTPATVREQGGVWRAAFAGTRPWDMASLVLLLSPLAIAIPGLAAALGRMPGRGREIAVLAALALPFAAILPFIHPVHGLHRDWDDFAATGVALSLVTAWLVGETLRGAPRRAWVAVAVTLAVAMPALQWLLAHVETTRGIARVKAFVTEPPLRSPPERGHTWDFVGIRNYRLQRYAEAQAAFARAAETAPSPRILQEWAVAATYAGDLPAAQNAWRRVLEKNPDDAMAWMGLAAISMRLRDVPEAKRAALGLERVIPGHETAQRILADIARYEQLQADSVRRARGG